MKKGHLNERTKRIGAAAEARVIGHGGVSRVSEASGLARSTIQNGFIEIDSPEAVPPINQVRKSGGERKASSYYSQPVRIQAPRLS